MSVKDIQTFLMVAVVGVYICVERSGVYQDGYWAAPSAKISSILSEMSVLPLRPAPAAPSRRRPPSR